MSRTYGSILIVLLIVVSPFSLTAADEAAEMLARAEALYYQADFAKSVELLLQADELLQQQAAPLASKANVKLQLALSYIGLNDSPRAKTYLGQLYAMDADHRLDPQMFSPKVIKLADEAKAEQDTARCDRRQSEAQALLAAGDSGAIVDLLESNRGNCSALVAFYPKAADLVFKQGLELYKKPEMTEALQKFRAALALEPNHELAAQYVELTERKLEVSAEAALLAWRKDFQAGQYAFAARDYRELKLLSGAKVVDEARLEYRRALSGLVDSWNRACANNDAPTMEKVRVEINSLLPEPSFGQDIIGNMKTCAPAGCIAMETQLALARLKTRVEPRFSSNVLSQIKVSPVRVRVKAKINESGEVVGSEMQGGNPLVYEAIQLAVAQWKFTPAVTKDGARCVETEFQFVVNVAGAF